MLRIHVNEKLLFPNLTCFGKLDRESTIELLVRARELTNMARANSVVINLCNVEKDLPLTEIYKIINSHEFSCLSKLRIALVIEPEFLVPNARVLSVLGKNRGVQICNFISIDTAHEWIQSDYQLAS